MGWAKFWVTFLVTYLHPFHTRFTLLAPEALRKKSVLLVIAASRGRIQY
jgi:hypothetical protein